MKRIEITEELKSDVISYLNGNIKAKDISKKYNINYSTLTANIGRLLTEIKNLTVDRNNKLLIILNQYKSNNISTKEAVKEISDLYTNKIIGYPNAGHMSNHEKSDRLRLERDSRVNSMLREKTDEEVRAFISQQIYVEKLKPL